MSEKIEGGLNLPNQEKEATKESVIAIADKYLDELRLYKDNEQVVAIALPFIRVIVLDETRLRNSILNVKKQVESGEIAPNKALADLWHGDLLICKQKVSEQMSKKVTETLESEIEGLKKIVS
ncbi:MAG: hypothetical protein V1928_01375 [Parcubacteria group bacterium]